MTDPRLSRKTPLRADKRTRRQKNNTAIRLLDTWLADESGYDESVWPGIKHAIEEDRLPERRNFRE